MLRVFPLFFGGWSGVLNPSSPYIQERTGTLFMLGVPILKLAQPFPTGGKNWSILALLQFQWFFSLQVQVSPLVIKHGLGSSVSLNGVSVSWETRSNFCQLARFHTRRAVPRPARFLILTGLAQKQKWNKLWRAQEKPSMIWGGSAFGLFEAGWNDGEPTLQTSWKSFKVAQGCFLTWLAGWYPRAFTDHAETISPVSSGAII
jgi:hypothetical protein